MRLQGSTRSPLGAPVLWAALRDPERLAGALPGVRLIDVVDERMFRVRIAPATALGATVFLLLLRIESEREPSHVRISGHGRSGEHAVELSIEVDLAPAAGGTTVAWAGDVRFLGVLGSIGQRVLPHIATEYIGAALDAASREPVAA
jgi:carbon monoxide dehydrogenase subunit G